MYKVVKYNLSVGKNVTDVLDHNKKLKNAYEFVGDYITRSKAKNVTGAPRNYNGIYIRKDMKGLDHYGLMIDNNPVILSIQKI